MPRRDRRDIGTGNRKKATGQMDFVEELVKKKVQRVTAIKSRMKELQAAGRYIPPSIEAMNETQLIQLEREIQKELTGFEAVKEKASDHHAKHERNEEHKELTAKLSLVQAILGK